jgi:membrane-associated HD superfamily phosphohydrolase
MTRTHTAAARGLALFALPLVQHAVARGCSDTWYPILPTLVAPVIALSFAVDVCLIWRGWRLAAGLVGVLGLAAVVFAVGVIPILETCPLG